MTLKRVVESRAFDLTIQVFIVLSLVGYCIETLPDLDTRARWCLSVLETVAVVLFTVEYVLRVLVAEQRLRFVFSFFGVIDLLAILPFYLAPGFGSLALRALRLLRLFRIFKMVRYTKAIDRIRNAVLSVKEELFLYLFVALLLIFLSSVGIHHFESEAQPDSFGSVFHCMWWSVVTLTTVGYGDVLPITIGGRIFASVVLLSGVGIVAAPAALLSSALTKTCLEEKSR